MLLLAGFFVWIVRTSQATAFKLSFWHLSQFAQVCQVPCGLHTSPEAASELFASRFYSESAPHTCPAASFATSFFLSTDHLLQLALWQHHQKFRQVSY